MKSNNQQQFAMLIGLQSKVYNVQNQRLEGTLSTSRYWLLKTVCIERGYFKFLKLHKNQKF